MQELPEESAVVVADLWRAMKARVTDYGPGALEVDACINGTAFFPGGAGLWRGIEPMGEMLSCFPKSPVRFLGHNFDSVEGFRKSCGRGIEEISRNTWLALRRYMQDAGIDPYNCFFTNVLVGLQPKNSRGEMMASEIFKEQCRQFLCYQIARIEPRLIIVLGKHTGVQFDLVECGVRSVKLDHPSYPVQSGLARGEEIFLRNIAELKKALADVGY